MKTQKLKAVYKANCKKAYKKSKWNNGVNTYAIEILDNLCTYTEEVNSDNLCEYILNGAKTWLQYSEGGCSLIYDYDIMQRLCTKSEIKRLTHKDGSIRNPNKTENWIECQARALYQAYRRIKEILINWETL